MELDGEKKPKAKSPPSDMMAEPGESSLPGTSRSSEAHKANKRRRAPMQMEMEVMDAKFPAMLTSESFLKTAVD